MKIPKGHWQDSAYPYIAQNWEPKLRAVVEERPDPAKRFTWWLNEVVNGARNSAPRLTFIEQPYLGWAEAVCRLVETVEKETRAAIAHDITHLDEQ